MTSHYCPRCGALLANDFLLNVGDTFDCPECDGRVELSVVAPEMVGAGPRAVDTSGFHPENPPGDRLQCHVSDRQLVLYIAPGPSKPIRAMIGFAVLWLGFTGVFSVAMFLGGVAFPDALFLVGFLGIFWAVGLTMLYFSLRGRFSKLYLLVEPDRLVFKREWLGRETFKEYFLDPASKAKLVEAYSQNNRRVHKVSVSTTGRDARFGTFLDPKEKKWIVDRINRHLAS